MSFSENVAERTDTKYSGIDLPEMLFGDKTISFPDPVRFNKVHM